jgi:hypothetical protein
MSDLVAEYEARGVIENPVNRIFQAWPHADAWLIEYVREQARDVDRIERVAAAVGACVLLAPSAGTLSQRTRARFRGDIPDAEREASKWAHALSEAHVSRLVRWIAIECSSIEDYATAHLRDGAVPDDAVWRAHARFYAVFPSLRRERVEAVVWILRHHFEGDSEQLRRVAELDEFMEPIVDEAIGSDEPTMNDPVLRRADARGTAGWWVWLA